MSPEEKEEIKQMIEDSITSTLHRTTLPICTIESNKMETLETIVRQLKEIVVGNGHVEGSLLWESKQSKQEIEGIKKLIERRGKERDPFSIFVYYLTDKILPTLITTGLLAFIAYQYALSQHIVITP